METIGQKRMVLSYTTPTQDQKEVAQAVKEKCAELIDLFATFKNDIAAKYYHLSPEEYREVSAESMRWIAEAMTNIETGGMFGVKAIMNY